RRPDRRCGGGPRAPPGHQRGLRGRLRALGARAADLGLERRHDLERGPARRARRHPLRRRPCRPRRRRPARDRRRQPLRVLARRLRRLLAGKGRGERGRGPSPRRPLARAPLRRRRARRRRPRRRARGEAGAGPERPRVDGELPLPPRPPAAALALPRGGQPARPARALRHVAPSARARVRVPLPLRVVRHRQPGPAPRGGQPLPRAGGAAGAQRLLARPVDELVRSWHERAAGGALSWSAWLLELLFPTRCAGCGAPGALFCAACRRAAPAVGPPWWGRCGAPTAWPTGRCSECAGRRLAFASARAAVCYAGSVRPAVRAWKERGLRRLAPDAAGLVAERVPRPAADVISYIPPDDDRSLRRGRHPARDLAVELGRRWELPVAGLLVRTRPVARQTSL